MGVCVHSERYFTTSVLCFVLQDVLLWYEL